LTWFAKTFGRGFTTLVRVAVLLILFYWNLFDTGYLFVMSLLLKERNGVTGFLSDLVLPYNNAQKFYKQFGDTYVFYF